MFNLTEIPITESQKVPAFVAKRCKLGQTSLPLMGPARVDICVESMNEIYFPN